MEIKLFAKLFFFLSKSLLAFIFSLQAFGGTLPTYSEFSELYSKEGSFFSHRGERVIEHFESYLFPAMRRAVLSQAELDRFKKLSGAISKTISEIESSSEPHSLKFRNSINVIPGASNRDFVFDLQSRFWVLKFLSASFSENSKPLTDMEFIRNFSYAASRFTESGRIFSEVSEFVNIGLEIRKNEILASNLKGYNYDAVELVQEVLRENSLYNQWSQALGVSKVSPKLLKKNQKMATRALAKSLAVFLHATNIDINDYPTIKNEINRQMPGYTYGYYRRWWLNTTNLKNHLIKNFNVNSCRYLFGS